MLLMIVYSTITTRSHSVVTLPLRDRGASVGGARRREAPSDVPQEPPVAEYIDCGLVV